VEAPRRRSSGAIYLTSYVSDKVFSDGTTLQMAAASGNASDGFVATLTVGVAG
jgi:hypothetical protein